jgi:hypothetical protein
MTLASRLYAIVDPLDTGRDPIALARAMLAGGARLLQLRLKTTATGALLETANAVSRPHRRRRRDVHRERPRRRRARLRRRRRPSRPGRSPVARARTVVGAGC